MKLKYNNNNDEVQRFINNDDSIYHFTQKETAIEYILNNSSLRLGDFKSTSDPQEYKRRMISAGGWGWEGNHSSRVSNITNSIEELISSCGFLSFCQNQYYNDELEEQGCLKSRMWSQYGGNHSGICLVFSKNELLKKIIDQLPSAFTIYSNSMTYKDPRTSGTSSDLDVDGNQLDEKHDSEIVTEYINSFHKEVFFQKQPDYKDENEFRVVVVPEIGGKASGEFIETTSCCLKAVILGDSFPEVYLPTIKALSNKLGVPYRKLHWEDDEYFLFKDH